MILVFSIVVSAQGSLSSVEKDQLKGLENASKAYVKMRNEVENGLPKLTAKATPEQIEAHQTALLKRMQLLRKGIPQGTIFTPESASVIRSIISRELKLADKTDLRTKAASAGGDVPIAVNIEYPESKEVLEMPPSLLIALPQLPKELRYRFAGNTLLLMEVGNRMIIDYLPNALR